MKCFLRSETRKAVLLIGGFLLLIVSIALFLFLPEYPRLAYAVLILSGACFILLAIKKRNELLLFIKKRGTRHGLNAFISAVLILGILVFINYIASVHRYKIDFTRSKLNTLSDQSIKVLKNLDKEIQFIAFVDQVTDGNLFRQVMEKYRYYTDKIEYEIVDPNKSPVKARNYNIVQYGTIIAASKDSETRIESYTEEVLTNAIIKLSRKEKKKIYFITGHGERDSDDGSQSGYSSLSKLLEGQNYAVEKLTILLEKKIPEDSKLLIIGGAKKAIFNKEIDVIENYLKTGGALLILSDPSSPKHMVTPDSNVGKVLKKRGIKLRDDVVVDPLSRLFGVGEAMPVSQSYAPDHQITANFKEPTFYPFAQSIDVSGVDKEKYDVIELCQSSPTSWGETDSKTGTISFNEGRDSRGPLTLAVLITDKKEKSSTIVVFGSSKFVNNKYVNHAGNADIFMNVVSFLIKDEDLISIRPRVDEAGRFSMAGSSRMIPVVTVYIIPLCILIGGIAFWYRRRKR